MFCDRRAARLGGGRTGTVLGHAGGERGVLRGGPRGGRLAGRRRGLGLLVVRLGLLRENIAAAARGMNFVRQSGEATRGGRASGGASGGAARGSDGGAGARFRRPRRDARRSRLAPDPPSRASARSRGAAEKSKKLAGTKLKRAFERGTVASPGTHRRRLGLGLGLGVLLRHGEKCAGVVRCVGVVAWARTRRERVHLGSPKEPRLKFATLVNGYLNERKNEKTINRR